MESFARIQSIVIENFKNIKRGQITFSEYGKGSEIYDKNITAVYGQNGSGKTALINAISLIKHIVMGKSLPSDIENYIRKGIDRFKIDIQFYFKFKENISIINYSLTIGDKNDEVLILDEEIKIKEFADKQWKHQISVIHYNFEGNHYTLLPKYLFSELNSTPEKALGLGIAQSLAVRVNPDTGIRKNHSLLFSQEFKTLLSDGYNSDRIVHLSRILNRIRNFCQNNLLIIDDETLGGISENQHAIPVFIKQETHTEKKVQMVIGAIPIEIYQQTKIPTRLFKVYENFVNQMNMVLPTIIPGITLRMTGIEEEYLPDGSSQTVFSMMTVRDGKEISLKYESAGVKKILCILSSLIASFNKADMCFVVDELDSGVFEYLIGQIVTVFKEDAKGQLIFTSHNLHVLELLDNKSIYITRFNSDNCYGTLPNVQTNNNKRLLYLRYIELSDDEEDIIYNKTNQYDISFAFDEAYELFEEGDLLS